MLLRIFLAVCNIKAKSRCALLRKIYLFFPGLRISINLQMLFSSKNNIFLFSAAKCLFVCDQVKPIHSLSRPITQTHFSATEFCTNCKCINQERWNISSMIKHSLIGGGGGGRG